MANIRTNVIKNSIDELTNISNFIKENTSAVYQDLMREAIRKEYETILAESVDEEDNEVEKEENIETQDTETEDTSNDSTEEETISVEDETETNDEGEESDSDFETEESNEIEESTPEDWSEFSEYDVNGVGEYDLSNADDETLVKVYKLLKNSDEVSVVKSDSKLELKDNQTGAEYLIDLDSTCSDGNDDMEDEDNSFSDEEIEDYNMNESTNRVFEVVLNEDANLGYTTSYQKNDPLTTPSMKEPGKNVNDWDAGVPKGKSKPWPGKGTEKKGKPFTEEDEMDMDSIEESENVSEKNVNDWGLNHSPKKGNKVPVKSADTWGTNKNSKGKSVNECGDACMEENEDLEEANLSQSRWNDTHAAHNRVPAANKDSYRRSGMQKTSKGATYRPTGGSVEESIMKKHNKIVAENKKMKETLVKLQNLISEAAVTNLNLGQIVKLFNENATTKDEKKEIIARFGKEAKTIQESKDLYAKISNELQKKNTMNINEEKQFTTESSNAINENTIYASKDLLASLNMMRKICK